MTMTIRTDDTPAAAILLTLECTAKSLKVILCIYTTYDLFNLCLRNINIVAAKESPSRSPTPSPA